MKRIANLDMTPCYAIKDRCRQGLIKYLERACAKIPINDKAESLDIGCGTGVPTLWLAGHFPGSITAIDTNDKAVSYLQQKIRDKALQDKVKAYVTSFFDFDYNAKGYDLILAEGFLNIIGFEKGFGKMLHLLKSSGYLVIHDEYKDHHKKCDFMKANQCRIVETIILDETVWWNDYYLLLEEEISKVTDFQHKGIFRSDLEEIRTYKTNPLLFQSIYYVIRKL